MNRPVTYAEWVKCFDQLKTGEDDEKIILCMEQGSIEWSVGVAERLTQHLYNTIEGRLKQTSELLQRELDSNGGDETILVKAILSARKRIAVLRRMSDLQAFPEHVRDAMSDIITEYAKSLQESLEKSALSDRTGRLSSLIRNNNITQFNNVLNVFSSSINTSNETNNTDVNFPARGIKSSRRKVIIHE